MTNLLERFCLTATRDCIVKWSLFVPTAIIFAGLSVCLYWVVIDRKMPIEIHRGEVVLYQQQMDDSWVFVVRWHATLKRRCGGIANRWIVDGFRLPLADIPYPAEAEPNEIGEEFTWEVPVHVPAYFVTTGHTSGQYRSRFLHHCNPLQERIFPIVDNPPFVQFVLPVSSQPEFRLKEGETIEDGRLERRSPLVGDKPPMTN